MSTSEDVTRKLEELWQRYLPTMQLRLASIQAGIESLEAGHLDSEAKRRASEDAHKLAGSLGTFGLAPSSAMAREIEHLFSESDSTESMARELRKLFDSIKRDIEGR